MFSTFLDSRMKTSLNEEKVGCYATWEWSTFKLVVSSNSFLTWPEFTSAIFRGHFVENPLIFSWWNMKFQGLNLSVYQAALILTYNSIYLHKKLFLEWIEMQIQLIEFQLISPHWFEGFGGKRALGFLLKSELCQKRSKFGMQSCLCMLNNVLHVFCLKFASFLEILRMQQKHIFPRASSGDLLLNVKQKKPFVSLNDEVTIIH